MEIQNSQYKTIKWCSLCFIHDICSLSWTLYERLHTTWLTLTISFNGHFHMRSQDPFLWTKFQGLKLFWNEILLSELILHSKCIRWHCYIQSYQVWETIAVFISIFSTTCVFMRENMKYEYKRTPPYMWRSCLKWY